jgi:hypothetical protein
MINRFAQQLTQNGYFSCKKKCFHIILQVFGHEALVEANALTKNAHCHILDIDVHRLATLSPSQLAYRKLFNPFKWLEFILVFPLEMLAWSLQRHALLLSAFIQNKDMTFLNQILSLYSLLMFFVIAPIVNLAVNIALAIPRRILAPVRYIIRPSIELALTHPVTFASLFSVAFLAVSLMAFSIFTGTFPLLLSLAITATISAAATPIAWSLAVKCTTSMLDVMNLLTTPHHQIKHRRQPRYSTAIITEEVHALNSNHTRITRAEEQDYKHTLALFTGTECLFYKPYKRVPAQRQANTKPSTAYSPLRRT